MAGMLYVNGFPGRQPVRPLGLQAYHSSAILRRDRDHVRAVRARSRRPGQWIDLSMQEATAAAVEHVAGSIFEWPRDRAARAARCIGAAISGSANAATAT